ncbi:MAG: FtsH protease activity modulator HflK [Alphaproteobacteria bacterium]|nr:FtsH protease activity modulator HflK [Alphaproteobacteria bacterium]
MPWNDNKGGGGGWGPGGGGRGPWGQGPSNGGGGRGQGPNIRPPDLDEVFKRARDWLRRMFPNQPPGGIVFFGGAAIALALWLFTGVYIVQPAEQGIVLRFGGYVDKLGPGLHIRLPYPIETVLRPNVEQENQVNVGFRIDAESARDDNIDVPIESMMLTGDENVVDIDFVVFWKVAEAENFLFQVAEVDETIKAVAESAMREAVGQAKIDSIQTEGRAEAQDKVRKLMQGTLDSYKAGVTITRILLRKVDPPSQVIDAFRDVQAARADQEKKRNEAQRHANTIIPQARGEAAKIEQDAEAYKQQMITEAQGEAQRFLSILDQYKNAKEVTRERMYIETMQRVLGGTNKIIIENKSGVVQYLPLPELRRTQTPATTTGGN